MATNFHDNFCDPTLSENNVDAPKVATDVDHPRHNQTEILRGKTLAQPVRITRALESNSTYDWLNQRKVNPIAQALRTTPRNAIPRGGIRGQANARLGSTQSWPAQDHEMPSASG
jgi:hypothetical protein